MIVCVIRLSICVIKLSNRVLKLSTLVTKYILKNIFNASIVVATGVSLPESVTYTPIRFS